jgi:hypothetical protein
MCRFYESKIVNAIQFLNVALILTGIIVVAIGSSLIPQTVTNSGNVYVGDTEQYNNDLRNTQLSSHGFQIIVIGLCIGGVSGISCIYISCRYTFYENGFVPPRRVTIHPIPTIIEIESRPKPENTLKLKQWGILT